MKTMPANLTLRQLSELDSGQTLVLTVNNRYARRILADLSAGLDAQRRVMALPDIVPLAAWLLQAGDQLSFEPDASLASHLLDGFGARWLWQQVIDEIESEHVLLDVAQAARLAMEADRLMSEWRLSVPPGSETSDYQRFRLWREAYRRRLEALDAEDATLGFERVCLAIEEGRLDFPFRTLVLAGFNEFSPLLEGLLGALRDRGVSICALNADQPRAESMQRVLAPDPDSEWRLAAQWARDCLSRDPQGRYAIVAAQLEGDVALAHRVLREALGAQGAQPVLPYNIAVARPLAEWPAARAAIAWLTLLAALASRRHCEPAEAGAALLAGHCVAHEAEAGARAHIDALWRRYAALRVSAGEFAQKLAQFAPLLGQAWTDCHEQALAQGGKAPIDEWVGRFKQWLQKLGFPGPSVLDSHAYQAVEAFERLLDRLARQAIVLGELGMGQAVAMLARLAAQTPFQPQRDPAARLDVQGFLEAEGGRWDGVWILGLTDETLPAAPRPNPLIPLAALRQANAPRATPERELLWAQALFESLTRCAPAVWVSSAQREGERELRPSPCIAGLEPAQQAPASAPPRPAAMQCVADDKGPPLPPGLATRGGIGVLDAQARNPLWAFAKYRLGASRLDGYAGLSDQNARGIFLHKCMELACRSIGGLDDLLASQASGELEALLDEAVRQAAGECLGDYGKTLRDLETARAVRVLRAWFQLEADRTPFVLRGVEQSFQWTHGALQLALRLDRIDQLADGGLVVIDYKTGGGNIDPRSDWLRARPVGLQLPFYAAVLADGQSPVAALVLARLHARKVEAQGLADGDCGFQGLAGPGDCPGFEDMSWAQLTAHWRDAIHMLAQEYADGVAVNQSLREDDLQYCDALPFLRLNEEAGHAD